MTIEFTSHYSNYLNQKNIIEWQTNNQYWEEQEKIFPKKETSDSYSDSDVEIIDFKKVEKEEKKKEEEKRMERKKNMVEQKKFFEEKLKENKEKMEQIKKKKVYNVI